MRVLIIGYGKAGQRWADVATKQGHEAFVWDKQGSHMSLADSFLMKPGSAIIATPPDTHFELACECIERGLSVMVEKPLSPKLEAWESLDGLIVPVTNYRFHPQVREIKYVIGSGDLGDVLGFRAEYVEPLADWQPTYKCDPWLEAGIHLLDYNYWLLGDRLSWFQAYRTLYCVHLTAGPLAESVYVSWSGRGRHHRVTVYGSEGMIEKELGPCRDMYVRQFKHFVACVEGREQPICPIGEAVKILKRLL